MRSTASVVNAITKWPEDALFQLQDCLAHTDLIVFRGSDGIHISFCIGSVTVVKRTWVFPSQKPRMTTEVSTLLKGRNNTFSQVDKEL